MIKNTYLHQGAFSSKTLDHAAIKLVITTTPYIICYTGNFLHKTLISLCAKINIEKGQTQRRKRLRLQRQILTNKRLSNILSARVVRYSIFDNLFLRAIFIPTTVVLEMLC